MSFLGKKAWIPASALYCPLVRSASSSPKLLEMTRGRHTREAFTLVEMLIVIAISAMLSSIAIGYSSVGKNEVALSVEAAKISQVILQAKSLSIATYGDASGACGYGVAFNLSAQTYSVFAYHPIASGQCPFASAVAAIGIASGNIQPYTEGTWNIPVAKGVVLYSTSTDTLADVLFYPPDPTTFLSQNDSGTFVSPARTSKVYLKTVGGGDTRTISVSPAGQVEF